MLKSHALCARHVIHAESAIFKIYCVKHADLHIENEYLRKGGSIRVCLQGRAQAGGKPATNHVCMQQCRDALIQGDRSMILLLDLHGHVCLEGCSLKDSKVFCVLH